MKHHIKDGLQILVAVLITGSLVASAAPLPTEPDTQPNQNQNVTAPAENQEQTETEIAPQTSVEPSKIVEEPEKVLTWQDNPNKCTESQWIAKEPPYPCIDKPTTATSAQGAGTSNPGASAVMPSGGRIDWLQASGIPENQWWAVDYIVSRESGWNPCAYNPGKSDCNANPTSACGLAQSYPCGKVPGHWTDPVANLKWQYQYVTARYGGYPQAVEYWKAYKHY